MVTPLKTGSGTRSNLEVSSLGQLIKIIRQPQMEIVVDKLIEFSGGKDEELRDISALGVYMVSFFDMALISDSSENYHR